MLGERFEKLHRGVISNIKKGNDPFKYCKNQLLESDINIANLENVVANTSIKSYPFSKFMIIEPETLDFLVENNIRVVNLANNHIFDHGDKAFYETKENLKKKEIDYFGFDEYKGIQKEPLAININGQIIQILGYDLSNLEQKEFNKRVIEINEIIASLDTKNDLLILSLHWGYEYTESPTSFMIKAVEKFFENGVSILYGHHPHILQGVAKINNKIFAPSLGNFIFDDERLRNRFTGILNVKIENGVLDNKFLTYLSNNKYQPEPRPDMIEKFNNLSTILNKNILQTADGNKDFDIEILEKSNIGHSGNMMRVRKEIIKYFYNYLPYVPQIIKTKLIDKRIKKLIKK